MEDFYINDHGASEFGAMLLSSWYVSGSTLTQNYLTSYTGSRITFCSTQYGLRSISLPVDIYGASPADAAAKRSALTAAFLGGTVELALPDGGTYTALLLDSGKAQEQDTDGCILSCTYTLAGYRHGALETLVLPADVQTFFCGGHRPADGVPHHRDGNGGRQPHRALPQRRQLRAQRSAGR